MKPVNTVTIDQISLTGYFILMLYIAAQLKSFVTLTHMNRLQASTDIYVRTAGVPVSGEVTLHCQLEADRLK